MCMKYLWPLPRPRLDCKMINSLPGTWGIAARDLHTFPSHGWRLIFVWVGITYILSPSPSGVLHSAGYGIHSLGEIGPLAITRVGGCRFPPRLWSCFYDRSFPSVRDMLLNVKEPTYYTLPR